MATLDVQGNPVRRLVMQVAPTERKGASQAIGASALKNSQFSYPPDELVVQCLMHSLGDRFEMTDAAKEWFDSALAERHRRVDLLADLDADIDLEWSDALMGYQRQAVHFGMNVNRHICSLERGLGKTIVAIATECALKSKRVLVVCPGYLKLNWEREIQKWAFEPCVVTRGDRAVREEQIKQYFESNTRFLVVNYEMIRPNKKAGGYPELLSYSWDAVIFDEAHRLKGRSSQWTEGAKQFRKIPRVQFLTGNPIANTPNDIWQLLNLIDPLKFSSYWAFVEWFMNLVDTFFGKEIVGVNQARLAQL